MLNINHTFQNMNNREYDMRQHLARLVYKEADRPPVVIDIDDEIIIKRSPEKYSVVCEKGAECYNLDMLDPSVSGGKGHARIFWENDKIYIQDLGSTNGTYLLIDRKEIPLKGWNPGGAEKEPTSSEKVQINKTQRVRLGEMEFLIELVTIQNLNVEGDYLSEGASKIAITDSVIQRSNISGGSLKAERISGSKGSEQVVITDSIVQRSNIGDSEKRCPQCGKKLMIDLGICPRCRNVL